MGKALLLLVLGSSIALSTQLFTSQESEGRTALAQRGYEEETIARDVSVSAFNVAMGDIRHHGTALVDAVQTFNDGAFGARTGTLTGTFAGSRYTSRAVLTSGHSVRVISTGQSGYDPATGTYRASYTMHDEYRIPVLTANQASLLNVRFVESVAGYCSAVFYQAYTSGMPEGTVPTPQLLFSANNSDRRNVQPAREIVVQPGTQMNFFIGVDQNCSSRTTTMNTCQERAYTRSYTFDPTTFDHVHHALDIPAASLSDIRENVWALVEQNPAFSQRWRIAWEDIERRDWDNPTATSSLNSLQATKAYGYSGTGWPSANSEGYRVLADYSNRPDFNDQVIEVSLTPLTSAEAQARLAAERQTEQTCNPPPTTPPPTTPPPTTPPPTTPPPGTTNGAGCTCQGKKKVYVMHRPPGNESNEQRICISTNAVSAHIGTHNDYIICQGS